MSDESTSKRVHNYELAELFQANCVKMNASIAGVQAEVHLVNQLVCSMKNDVESNNRALRGSNGREGLLTRFARVETSIEALKQMNALSLEKWNNLFVVVMGDKDQTGMREEMHDLQKWKKSLQYWYMLLIAAVVTGVINIILRLFQ